MRCSGCGKDVPFAGQVCPYCHRDKTADKETHSLGMSLGFIGLVVGYLVFGFVGACAGFVVGGVAAFIIVKPHLMSRPPVVRIAPPPPDPSAERAAARLGRLGDEVAPDVPPRRLPRGREDCCAVPVLAPPTASEGRLRNLNDLLKKGLIDEGEYATRRKAILDEL